MKDTPTRVFGLMCVLVGVWTTVYWLYEPGEPPITVDQRRPSGEDDPTPMAELSPPMRPAPARGSDPTPANPARTDRAATRVVPPEFVEYTVQQGDTLEVIAKRFFGDGRLWTKIAEANGLSDPNKLVPGRTRLRIPKDPSNVQGKEVAMPPLPDRQGPAAQPPPASPAAAAPDAPAKQAPAAPAFQEYVVKKGDTLSDIAKAFYGKSSLWRKIYDANKDVIPDPDAVKPGTTIRIPPKD